MHFIVCLKQIVFTYARTGMAPEKHFLGPEDSITRINPHDEAALELALRAKESLKNSRVTLLTLGPLIAESELRRCLAMGADRLCRIDLDGHLDSWAKARGLSRFIGKMDADLVFCGKESLDRRNGQVGAFMARELGWSLVSAVRGLTLSPDGAALKAERSAGRGTREVVACPLPAVCTVEIGAAEPRYPSYPKKIWAWSRPIEPLTWEGEEPAPRLRRSRIFLPRPRPKPLPAPDSALSAQERIRQLLAGSRVDKTGLWLTGDPLSQIAGIVSFLKKHDFLQQKTRVKNGQEPEGNQE